MEHQARGLALGVTYEGDLRIHLADEELRFGVRPEPDLSLSRRLREERVTFTSDHELELRGQLVGAHVAP